MTEICRQTSFNCNVITQKFEYLYHTERKTKSEIPESYKVSKDISPEYTENNLNYKLLNCKNQILFIIVNF